MVILITRSILYFVYYFKCDWYRFIQVDHLEDKTKSIELFAQVADPLVGKPPCRATPSILQSRI